MSEEEDAAGVEAVAAKAMDATPNANAPTTTRPSLLQTPSPNLKH